APVTPSGTQEEVPPQQAGGEGGPQVEAPWVLAHPMAVVVERPDELVAARRLGPDLQGPAAARIDLPQLAGGDERRELLPVRAQQALLLVGRRPEQGRAHH